MKKQKHREVKVAYIKQNIEGSHYIISEGSVFIVDKKNDQILRGFWKGGTYTLEKIHMHYDWEWKDKIVYYLVPKKCLVCKYCKYREDGWYCNEWGCVCE